jgi:hypothetical protein
VLPEKATTMQVARLPTFDLSRLSDLNGESSQVQLPALLEPSAEQMKKYSTPSMGLISGIFMLICS